jgi:hypothetical protein
MSVTIFWYSACRVLGGVCAILIFLKPSTAPDKQSETKVEDQIEGKPEG